MIPPNQKGYGSRKIYSGKVAAKLLTAEQNMYKTMESNHTIVIVYRYVAEDITEVLIV